MFLLPAGCSGGKDLPSPDKQVRSESEMPGLDALRSASLAHLEDEAAWRSFRVACKRAGGACTTPLQRELELLTESERTRVMAHTRLGQLHASLHHMDEARSAYQKALDAVLRQGDPCEAVKLHYLLAGMQPTSRLRRKALHRTAEKATACGATDYFRRATNRIALECRSEGLYLAEKQALDQLAIEEEREGPGESSLRLRLWLADWNRRMGRLDSAREQLEPLLENLRQRDNREGITIALLQLGVIDIDRGLPMKARGRFLEALEAAKTSDHPEWGRDGSVLAALALLRAGRSEEALGAFEALSMTDGATADLVDVELLLYRGEALRDLGRLEEAVASFRKAVERSEESRNKELGWETLAGLAETLREQGKLPEARQRAKQAVALIEELRDSVTGHKQGELTHFLHLRADAYTVYALTSAALGAGQLEDTFGAMEGSHARVLRESLAVETPSETAAPSVSLEELQEGLAPRELLLEYQLGERASLLLVVDRAGARTYPLPPRAELEDKISGYLEQLLAPLKRVVPSGALAPDPRELLTQGKALFDELLGPIADRLSGTSRLIIVPDRRLHRLPFEALPLPGEENEPLRFLGTETAVSYLPAASLYERSSGLHFEHILAIAASSSWPTYALPRLEHADKEAAAVAALYPASMRQLLGEADLTANNLVAALAEQPDVLHIAAHAIVLPREGPRVLLGHDPVSGHAQVLDAQTVAVLPAVPSLVILSSCDTAGGDVLGGEGVLGLVRAFTLAGSKDIVASLWPVEDESAERLMVALHRGLRRGESPSRAMLAARRAVSKAYGPHPYYWSGFVIYGSN